MTRHKNLLMTVFLATAFPCAAWAEDFEQPREFQADSFLPAEIITGDLYTVDATVSNDGILNTYVVHSKYGEFPAQGTPLLMSRIREVQALSEMEAISKSDIYLQGAKDAGISMAQGVGNIFTDPVGSAKAIPSGIGRMFGGVVRGVQRGGQWVGEQTGISDEIDPTTEAGLRTQNMQVNSSEREWAQKLKIDPYTSNPKMREALSGVAWVDTLGDWTTGLVASVAVPVSGLTTTVSLVQTSMDEIYTEEPGALIKANRALLEEGGADPDIAEAFLNSGWYSPTLQTLMVRSLASHTDLKNRWSVLQTALKAGNEAQARFFGQTVILLGWVEENYGKLASIVDDGGAIIGAVTENNNYLLFLPADYLLWTEEVAKAAQAKNVFLADKGYASHELVVMGTVSDRTRSEVTAMGWVIHERTSDAAREYLMSIGGAESDEAGDEKSTDGS